MSSDTQPQNTTGLNPIPESGGAPPERVKDMKTLHSIYTRFLEDDRISSYNRSLVRDAADGAPPFEEADIEQDGRYNLNFHGLAGVLDQRNAVYTDLIDSVPSLVRVYFPETYQDPPDKEEKQAIIAEEITQLIREDWGEFENVWDILINEMCSHGVSLAYFPDKDSWKWQSAGWDEFWIPRQTKASEEKVDILFIRDQNYPVHALLRVINNKSAEELGWDKKSLKQYLVKVTQGDSKAKAKDWENHWVDVQTELANNDFGTYSKGQFGDIIHAFVREYNGSLSHYIFPSCGTGKNFLFRKRSRFEESSQAFTIFTARAGRNGQYHSIRGDLYRAYPEDQAINRLRCSALDSASLSMSTLLQPAEAESMEDMAIMFAGPVSWLPPEANLVQNRVMPNLSQGVMPLLQDLDSTMRDNLGLARPEVIDANTQYGQQFQQVTMGALTRSQVSRFYKSLKRLYNEMVRRLQKLDILDPNVASRFPEVIAFYNRLMIRGVPPELFRMVERVEPCRAAGNGSVGHRFRAFEAGFNTLGMLDEVGRAKFLQDYFSELFGRDLSRVYVGSPEAPRFNVEERIALMENEALRTNPEIMPALGENGWIHGSVHLAKADQEVAEAEAHLTQKGDVDPTPVIPLLQHAEVLLRHTGPHIEAISQDPTREREFNELRKYFQQIGAKLESMIELAQRLTPSDEVQQGHLSKMEMKRQEHMLRMQTLVEESQLKRQIKAAEARQRIEAARATTDARISTAIRKSASP